MPKFSKRSVDNLATVDRRLYDICSEAIKKTDFVVICGHRGKEDQDKAIAEGTSKTPWPTSKHNSSPSMAVDLVPYPIDWKDIERFRHLAGVIFAIADEMGVKLRWGGSFISLKDYPHFEIVD